MIPDEEKFQFAKTRNPSKPNPDVERELEAMGFRPFGYEW